MKKIRDQTVTTIYCVLWGLEQSGKTLFLGAIAPALGKTFEWTRLPSEALQQAIEALSHGNSPPKSVPKLRSFDELDESQECLSIQVGKYRLVFFCAAGELFRALQRSGESNALEEANKLLHIQNSIYFIDGAMLGPEQLFLKYVWQMQKEHVKTRASQCPSFDFSEIDVAPLVYFVKLAALQLFQITPYDLTQIFKTELDLLNKVPLDATLTTNHRGKYGIKSEVLDEESRSKLMQALRDIPREAFSRADNKIPESRRILRNAESTGCAVKIFYVTKADYWRATGLSRSTLEAKARKYIRETLGISYEFVVIAEESVVTINSPSVASVDFNYEESGDEIGEAHKANTDKANTDKANKVPPFKFKRVKRGNQKAANKLVSSVVSFYEQERNTRSNSNESTTRHDESAQSRFSCTAPILKQVWNTVGALPYVLLVCLVAGMLGVAWQWLALSFVLTLAGVFLVSGRQGLARWSYDRLNKTLEVNGQVIGLKDEKLSIVESPLSSLFNSGWCNGVFVPNAKRLADLTGSKPETKNKLLETLQIVALAGCFLITFFLFS